MKRRIVGIISAAILVVFLLASVLFYSQGGFGGGHLRHDFILYLLAIPWIFLLWPETFWVKAISCPSSSSRFS
jgi:hypothetical protein